MREIARRGHSVENHSYRHSHAFACFGIGRMSREIVAAHQVATRLTGRAPDFFRPPPGVRSPLSHFARPPPGLRYLSLPPPPLPAPRPHPPPPPARPPP